MFRLYVPSLTAMGSWLAKGAGRGAGLSSHVPASPWTGVAGWELSVNRYKLVLPLAAWLLQLPQR